ncbi:MAG: RnfABCDGE type electron transport complex subunit D [Desulfobacteraceae bacterium]|nr:RnfABCDGE type electron transport complex subunit D [Desulfobacteraceae bacterium]MBC2756043.1 RnfABCDGE type electron transport complex subunit D [Desulfobacteraceae bacterium]
MHSTLKLTVSHAPFWHNGSSISSKSRNILLASLLAVIPGCYQYGSAAVGVVTLSIASAILWELLINFISRRPISVGDGNAALIGMMFAMMLPATTPWWAVVTGTFFAVVIGKEIFGGIGANPFNPAVLAMTILMLSWGDLFDFNAALLNYQFDFNSVYPLVLSKSFGAPAVESLPLMDLLQGKQIGGIGSTFGIGLILGGVYLMLRGVIRWEISISFLAGIFAAALCFNILNPELYAGPGFHLLTGYTLIGAFFLATEDSSSPVNFIPMLIYGLLGGALTVLIRNIGTHIDGVLYAILIINLVNPIVDKIRPKALGKGV